jgi:hypothetical protein
VDLICRPVKTVVQRVSPDEFDRDTRAEALGPSPRVLHAPRRVRLLLLARGGDEERAWINRRPWRVAPRHRARLPSPRGLLTQTRARPSPPDAAGALSCHLPGRFSAPAHDQTARTARRATHCAMNQLVPISLTALAWVLSQVFSIPGPGGTAALLRGSPDADLVSRHPYRARTAPAPRRCSRAYPPRPTHPHRAHPSTPSPNPDRQRLHRMVRHTRSERDRHLTDRNARDHDVSRDSIPRGLDVPRPRADRAHGRASGQSFEPIAVPTDGFAIATTQDALAAPRPFPRVDTLGLRVPLSSSSRAMYAALGSKRSPAPSMTVAPMSCISVMTSPFEDRGGLRRTRPRVYAVPSVRAPAPDTH